MMKQSLIAAASVVSLSVSAVAAEPKSDGFKLAAKLCSRCHSIGSRMPGKHPKAPAFQEIANRYSVWNLQEALAEGIMVGHTDMPRFVLQPNEINDLLTYMASLQTQKKKAVE